MQGAKIRAVAKLPASLAKRQSVPLVDEGNETQWSGAISIGTPSQDFRINFDSKYSRVCIILARLTRS